MPWDYFAVVERDHALQNPTSSEKLLEVGGRLRLRPDFEILDIASGRGGPAILLAKEFGCRVHGIELRHEFYAAAIERAADAGVADRVTFELGDASQLELPVAGYDVGMCLGATFVWGGLAGTLHALERVVRPGGHVVVGEPFWRRLPLPEGYEERGAPYTTLEGTVAILESGGLRAIAVVASSEDDWDRYETMHWRAAEVWLAKNSGDPQAREIGSLHERFKRAYLRYGRDHLGWAIFAGWKRL
jgi:SAM-dependent methyltransferase